MNTTQNTLLEGNLGSISLPNLLQLIAMEQKSAMLVLNRVEIGQSAELAFRRGELFHARVNHIEGHKAVYRILGWWNAGTFKLIELNEHEAPEPSVTLRMDYLLLEGMRQMDACQQYRELLPALTSAVSFTQSAMGSFQWDHARPAEWIPHEVRQLPRSFSMAQLHQVCDLDELELAGLMRMLLATQAVRVHTGQDEYGVSPAEVMPSTRYEAYAHLLMEYVGYDEAYGLLNSALFDMGWDDLEQLTFSQLLDLSDRLSIGLAQNVDRRALQEASRKLRARATSLI